MNDVSSSYSNSQEDLFAAFTVGLTRNFTRTSINKGVVLFDKVQLTYPRNVGYDINTGVYTTPISGKYSYKILFYFSDFFCKFFIF